MVADGNDLLGYAVVINAEIIFPSLSDFPTAVALLYTTSTTPKAQGTHLKLFKRCSWTFSGMHCSASCLEKQTLEADHVRLMLNYLDIGEQDNGLHICVMDCEMENHFNVIVCVTAP